MNADAEKKEYFRKYYIEHKAELKKKHKCELCGGTYDKLHKSSHQKTNKHKMADQQKKIEDLQKKINTIKENLND